MSYFKPLKSELQKYLSQERLELVYQAFLRAEQAHSGQKRHSGEPYITHPVAASEILASMRLDAESIMAALLHDVLEDTLISKAELTQQFGEQVAELVDGVSKLTQIHFENRAEAQAENFRKMILAMSRDIRVILIKLADRLHNMRTLDVLDAQKRKRIARETLDIYVPIANRLGMRRMVVELEDLTFKILYPQRYRVLDDAIKSAHGNSKKIISTIEKTIGTSLTQAGINYIKITGNEKHLYTIYKRMQKKHLAFSQITDIFVFRIVTKDLDTCYRVLGAVHNLYKPVAARFKDYIAIPKVNGYQALHTTLFGPFGVPIEVQIRAEDMDRLAEYGIAAQWMFQSSDISGQDAQARTRAWLKSLIELQQRTGDSLEFIENVKIDLFPDEVYVFTPKGGIFELPKGSTAVDFAYAVHSDIGNTCVAVKIDRKLAALNTPLSSGQTVEVITAPKACPNPMWLSFVVTGKAKSNIRHYLKKQRTVEAIELGKQLLATALSIPLKKIPEETLANLLSELHLHSIEHLYENIGLGNYLAAVIAERLLDEIDSSNKATHHTNMAHHALSIKGTEGIMVRYAECCRPIPGDKIMGVLIRGQGITIHRSLCPQINKIQAAASRCVDVCWAESIDQDFSVDLIVEVANQRGVLASLATAIAISEANIDNINVSSQDGRYSLVSLTISIKDRKHLARAMRRIRNLETVVKITRS